MDAHRARLDECRDDDAYPSALACRFAYVSHFASDGNDDDDILMRNNYWYLDSDDQWRALATRGGPSFKEKQRQVECSSFFPHYFDKSLKDLVLLRTHTRSPLEKYFMTIL
jgi:hypothetical protein